MGKTPVDTRAYPSPARRRARTVDDDTNELPALVGPVASTATLVADEGVIKDLADELARRIFQQRWWWGLILATILTALVVGGGAYIWHLAERIDRLEAIHK